MASITKVLITGGTGFVGYWMQQTKPAGILAGFRNHNDYAGFWETSNWNAIVHLAPVSPARVLAYASRHKVRVLFASSGAVYKGTNEYADNKRKWEQECLNSGANVIIARLFTFVGAHLKNLYAITNFIENAKRGKPLEVWGGGNSVRSYLYGEDLGRWMWKLLLEGHNYRDSGAYDVGGPTPFFILDLARLVTDIIPASRRYTKPDYPNSYYVPNVARAHALGCEETIGLREAIERMINDTA